MFIDHRGVLRPPCSRGRLWRGRLPKFWIKLSLDNLLWFLHKFESYWGYNYTKTSSLGLIFGMDLKGLSHVLNLWWNLPNSISCLNMITFGFKFGYKYLLNHSGQNVEFGIWKPKNFKDQTLISKICFWLVWYESFVSKTMLRTCKWWN